MYALAVVVCEIESHELRPNLAYILTSSISKPSVVKTPKFGKILLSSSQSTTQNLDVLGFVVREISPHELRSHLAFLQTLSISKPSVVQTTNFKKILLSSSQSTTQNLDALAIVVCEISSHELRPNLAYTLTSSISKPYVVQTPGFKKIKLSWSQSSTKNLDALAIVVCEISSHELRPNLAYTLTLSISKPYVVQTPDFRKIILSSSQSPTKNLDALAVVVCEMSTHK